MSLTSERAAAKKAAATVKKVKAVDALIAKNNAAITKENAKHQVESNKFSRAIAAVKTTDKSWAAHNKATANHSKAMTALLIKQSTLNAKKAAIK